MLMLESLLEQSGKTLLHFKYGGKMENIENLKVNTLLAINDAADLKMLDEIRVSVLGKKGAILKKTMPCELLAVYFEIW